MLIIVALVTYAPGINEMAACAMLGGLLLLE